MSAAITDKFKKGYGFFSTTLSAQKNSGASSMSLSDATGVPTTTGLVFTVGRVNSSGTLTPSTRAIYKGTLSGTTVSNLTLTEGTDQTHAAGSVVEITFTATHWNDAIDGILAEHEQDGTHGAVTATSVSTDTITEKTGAAGVTIDGLNIKDGALNTNNSVVTANLANNAVTPAKRTGGFAVGVFTITGTGNVSVTGVGFTPKMVEFVYLTTATSNARDGLGVMTATSQYSLAVSTSSSGNSWTTADTSTCMRCDSGGGTTFIVASYTSMDADGFTINVTTLASGPHVIGYKAFA